MELLSLLLNIPAICVLSLLASTSYVIYQAFISPLACFPGPFWAKITYWYPARLVMRGQVHRELIALHENYGSVVRVGPNYLQVILIQHQRPSH